MHDFFLSVNQHLLYTFCLGRTGCADGNLFDSSKTYQAAPATALPGQGLLVCHCLRYPVPLDAADRTAVPWRE
jgi:hypothetical protein